LGKDMFGRRLRCFSAARLLASHAVLLLALIVQASCDDDDSDRTLVENRAKPSVALGEPRLSLLTLRNLRLQPGRDGRQLRGILCRRLGVLGGVRPRRNVLLALDAPRRMNVNMI